MKPIKGLFRDVSAVDQPEGTYPYARNMVNSYELNALQNEKGFFKYNSVVPGDTILCLLPIGPDFVVFSNNTTTGVGHIGFVTITGLTLNYNEVYSSADLAFNSTARIKAEYQINAKNQRIVAWIEIGGSNPPRVINIDAPDVEDIKDLEVFPQYTGANVSTAINDTGGALLTASYLPIYKYKRSDLSETDWIVTPTVVSIIDEPLSAQITEIDGAPAGTPTGKSMLVTFTNSDTNYDKLVIGYIRRKGGITQAFRVSEVTNSANLTYSITGTETTTDVSLDEILTPNANYNNAQAITQLNNQLILGNLTSDDVLDLQAVANKVIVDYTCIPTATVAEARFKSGATPGTFQPGEVYALYLVVELSKGGLLAYHIPGRGPASGETDTTTTEVEGIEAKKFQVADTSLSSGRINKMSYWENSSERYPAGFPVGLSATGTDVALANQPVRHHKFPDLSTLLERHAGMSGSAQITASRGFDVRLAVTNVNIPAEIRPLIRGWKIAYAKRTYQNSLVLGADILQLASSHTENPNIIWTTGGNWNINAVSGSGDGAWQDQAIWYNNGNDTITKVQRGHCLDLMYDRPSVVPSYVEFVCKLRSPGLNTLYTGHGAEGGMLNRSGEGRGQAPGAVVDFTKTTARRSRISGTRKRRVSNVQYVPQNTIIGNISTKKSEEILYMEIDQLKATIESHGINGLLDFPLPNTPRVPEMETRSSGAAPPNALFAAPGPGCDYESTYYTYYKQILSDVYVSYTNQPLVLTSGRATPSTTVMNNIVGGDIHSCIATLMTTSVQSPTVQDSENAHIEGPRCFKYYVVEARHNWNYRHEETTAVEDWYAPKTDPRDFWNPRAQNQGGTSLIDTVAMKLNKLSYNTDYDMVNEFVPALIIDDVNNFSTTAPTAIIYSPVQNADSLESAWGSFPVNNRYVQPKNRGAITNLQGYRNKDLLIHHRDSLYITRSNLSLNAEQTDVKLSSSSLFDLSPEEILSTDQGYAGTRHPFACKLTKLGYTFPSDRQGKIFTYNGQLEEISAQGMRNFFRQYGEADSGYVEEEDIIIGDLLPVPPFGTNYNAWEVDGESYEVPLNVSSAGASYFGTIPAQGMITRNVLRPCTMIPGTTVNVTLRAGIESGMLNVATTFVAVITDADNNVLVTQVIGVTNNTVYQKADKIFTYNNITIPANAAKIGFKFFTGYSAGTASITIKDFKVVGSKVYTTVTARDIATVGYQLEFDEELNRLLVSKKSTESEWTLSYNPANKLWTSYHDYLPDLITSVQNKYLISAKNTDLFLHNAGPYGVYYTETVQPSYVDTVFNPEPTMDKILTNLEWQTEIKDGENTLWDKTADYITASSNLSCTGRIALNRKSNITGLNANTRVYNEGWAFNDIYDISTGLDVRKSWQDHHDLDGTKLDINMPWYKKRKFIGKYVICRFETTNTENLRFSLIAANAVFRPSRR